MTYDLCTVSFPDLKEPAYIQYGQSNALDSSCDLCVPACETTLDHRSIYESSKMNAINAIKPIFSELNYHHLLASLSLLLAEKLKHTHIITYQILKHACHCEDSQQTANREL